MKQIARNLTDFQDGFLKNYKYLIHDRDSQFSKAFSEILGAVGVETIRLPRKSPNLNPFAERWIGSVKSEPLSKMLLFGEKSLHRLADDYVHHFHTERNHLGKGNVILFPSAEDRIGEQKGIIKKRERLPGLLNFYYREAG